VSTDPKDETVRTTSPEPPSTQPEIETFRVRDQRFSLGKELGRGGMGKVLAARDISLRRGVAIKKVLSTRGHDLIRFQREVRITAELEHPSIVPIHDVGIDDDGCPFYVMRQIEGEPLASRIAALGTLRARLALLPNVLAVTDAAAFAHARNIIHRDIKPANILLGSYGETLLIDWGLARRLDEEPEVVDAAHSLPSELTLTGHVYGTTAYMAPEQARGEPVDARADVYALGATLFHVLAGRGPFEGMSAATRIESAALDHPAPFAKLPDDAAPELRAIVVKAMANDATARYPNAGALAADLRAFLEGQLVGAHTYTVRERARRFVRRHRAAVAVAVLAIIALITGGAVAITRVIDERSEAHASAARAEAARIAFDDRDERLRLERASKLSDHDPVRAIALLRHQPVTTPNARWMQAIAAKAAARGIARGDHVHRDMVTALELSPDGRSVATADRRGRVVVRELASARGGIVAELGNHVLRLGWLDASTVIANARDGLAVITVGSGAVRTIARGRTIGMLDILGPDRVRVVDTTTRELVDIEIAADTSRVLAHDVDLAVSHGDRAVVSGKTGLRWWISGREIAAAPIGAVTEFGIALSPDGRRVAIARGDEVIEWDDTGREVARWPVPFAIRTFYGPQVLYATSMRNQIIRLGKEVRVLVAAPTRIADITRLSGAVAVMLETGRVLMLHDTSVRDLPLAAPAISRADSRGSTIAIGSRTGEVLWWSIDKLAPIAIDLGQFSACAIDDKNYYVFREPDLIAIDRETHEMRTVATTHHLTLATCLGVTSSRRLVFGSPYGGGVIDLDTGEHRRITPGWMSYDAESELVFFGRGRELVVIEKAVGAGRVLWTAPAGIVDLDLTGKWIAVRLSTGELVRLDRETTATELISTRPGPYRVTRAGDVWYATDRWLWRWTERGPAPYGEFSKRITELGADGDPLLVRLQDSSLWTVTHDRQQRKVSNLGRLLRLGRKNLVVFEANITLTLLDLATGERVTFPLPETANSAVFSSDERAVLVHLSPGQLMVFHGQVPEDPEAFKRWLATVTNAEVDVRSDVLTWSTPR
jgi:hypothetical protein